MAGFENKTTSQLIREINKNFEGVVRKGFTPDEYKPEITSLGSISLDFTCYGGLTMGRMVEISGAESAGKSLLASLIIGAYQRKHPNEQVLYMDLEGTFDPTWGVKLGMNLDEDHFIYYESLGQSGEDIINHLVGFIRSGVRLAVIDSLPKLVPDFILEENDMAQKSMGGNAKLLADFVNRYSGLIHRMKALVIGINQIRDNMSGYGDPYKTTGGRAWKHECSTRLMVKRGDFFDKNGEKVKKKDAQSPAGHYVEMYVLKNKDAPWDRKVGFTKLHYWKGIDYVSDLMDVAIYFNLIENEKVGWFGILDEEGNPMLNEEGKPIRVNGKNNLLNYLREHREVSSRLYKKVYEMMTVKESGYLKGFEEMLGVDNTMFEVDDDGDLVVSEEVEDPVTKKKKKIKVDKETGEVIE